MELNVNRNVWSVSTNNIEQLTSESYPVNFIMKVVQAQASIVVLADSHNPTIVTKEWLARKEILAETPVDFTHTPYFSSVETTNFILYVDPQRLRVDAKNINQVSLSGLPEIIKKYVEKLSEVPYSAVVYNSRWQVHDMPHPDKLKAIFSGNAEQFTKVFGKQHNVGGIVLWEYDAFRVQLTANPAQANPGIDLNYHSNVEVVDDLYKRLSKFVDVTEHANRIVNDLLGGETLGHESSS